MVTARSRFGIRWVRVLANPLRLLWLAALLLGFVSLHAVSAEAVSGHLTGCEPRAVASAAYGEAAEGRSPASAGAEGSGAEGRHHDDEAAHSAHECVLAQPEQGPELAAPCPALPDEGASGAARHTPSSHPAGTTAAGSVSPDLRRTAVLRI
jgi:hypothetical protein